jgi:competence protein ComEA
MASVAMPWALRRNPQPDRSDRPSNQEPIMIRTLIAIALTSLSLGAFAAIDVNKASAAELDALPGVGPALSARIVTERQKAPFKNWADMIQRVRGVGQASAAKLSKAGLTVANAEFKPATGGK